MELAKPLKDSYVEELDEPQEDGVYHDQTLIESDRDRPQEEEEAKQVQPSKKEVKAEEVKQNEAEMPLEDEYMDTVVMDSERDLNQIQLEENLPFNVLAHLPKINIGQDKGNFEDIQDLDTV